MAAADVHVPAHQTVHLICNLFFGFRICALAERQLGGWRFLVLYIGSGLVGSAVSVIGHDTLSAGASGALFGVVGWMLVALRARFGSWKAFVQAPGIRQQLIWIAGWFVLGAYMGFDDYAHSSGCCSALFTPGPCWATGRSSGSAARLAIALGVGAALIVASLLPDTLDVAPELN